MLPFVAGRGTGLEEGEFSYDAESHRLSLFS